MARYARSRSYGSRSRTTARRGRAGRSTGRRRASASGRGRGMSRSNTVRIVIEQPSANPVSRPFAAGGAPVAGLSAKRGPTF